MIKVQPPSFGSELISAFIRFDQRPIALLRFPRPSKDGLETQYDLFLNDVDTYFDFP